MDAPQREHILAAARALGPKRFNALVESVGQVLTRGRLRYWQEEEIARLAGFTVPPITNAGDFTAVFGDAELLPEPLPEITREEFFARPNYWYYLRGSVIPDAWIAEAWEQLPKFRDSVTYEFVREASKNGDLYCLESSLKFLAGILPLTRMVEVYGQVRAKSPNREPEFRPTFQRVFGEKMVAFPNSLSSEVLEIRPSPPEVNPHGLDDHAIPF